MRRHLSLLLLAVLVTADTPPPVAAADGMPEIEFVDAFPGITFERPVYAAQAPDGTARMFVLEQRGRIVLVNHPVSAEGADRRVFLDISLRVSRDGNERGLLGLAFHPDFAENGRFFVHYSRRPDGASVISEFGLTSNPELADAGSERELLVVAQPYSNHNGGMLEFGPDGYLYIALGDGGSGGDPDNNGQDLGTLLGSLLRIDVDGKDPGREYRVPPDNPFVSRAGAKPEIWAYGLRNPWRFSFDRENGDLWLGDVGQNKFEEIDLVTRGGNYGWKRREGFDVFSTAGGSPADPFLDPVTVYDHPTGFSVTGGYVYRGARIPGLFGAYLFADYVTGRLWSLTRDGGLDVSQLLDTDDDIASFGEDRAGELYVCVFNRGGKVLRIEPIDEPPPADSLPVRLSETRLFDDLRRRVPVDRALRYTVGAQLWSDRAGKERFVVLPPGTAMAYTGPDAFDLPEDAWAVKTFTLKSRGRRRPLETRVIRRTEDGFLMGTYRWNATADEAFLLADRLVETVSGPKGGQEWTYPGPDDCGTCHTDAAGVWLGLSARQVRTPGGTRSALPKWTRDGLLVGDVPSHRDVQRNLGIGGRGRLERRVRSYLDSNCSFCHRPGAPQPAGLDLLASTPYAQTGMQAAAGHGDLGIADARVVAPGDPARSVLLRRMELRDGKDQMPRLGSSVPHGRAVRSLRRWIRRLR